MPGQLQGDWGEEVATEAVLPQRDQARFPGTARIIVRATATDLLGKIGCRPPLRLR